jgi:hypothetical protein
MYLSTEEIKYQLQVTCHQSRVTHATLHFSLFRVPGADILKYRRTKVPKYQSTKVPMYQSTEEKKQLLQVTCHQSRVTHATLHFSLFRVPGAEASNYQCVNTIDYSLFTFSSSLFRVPGADVSK